ncbi:DUF6985 domain-containing protein [Hymenobacter crusticola]|uniref:DUF6985 domain-containing protein n=1 Tax=Hymenobacter crusticola TaxID=1770526 RepID=A0A243WIX7_9BACT|nr:hypothetical protein [Hymenobacter crusticola]OUJ75845.1 hypothetical protein BXP70_00675 [Hymenobacter crusticola]
MLNWKETLRFSEFEGLTATVLLDFLRRKEPVSISFGEYGDMTELTSEAEAATEILLQRLPDLEQIVASTAFEHYQNVSREFKRIYGEKVEIPFAADAAALLPFYQLQRIYLPEDSEEGRFGLGFECEWEIEHGFGIQFRNWKIVEVGGDAEAFSFYD